MEKLNGKKIIVAISGSIAAYKIPNLVRLLVKAGASVKVIMTQQAAQLVSPLSLATVSKNPVYQNISDNDSWNNHISLAYWADALLIAPLTANTMAHLANGFCNNIIHAIYLAAKCPIFIAPAMDEDMWQHPATQKNLECLISRGCKYIPVENGELASGIFGDGRMAEPDSIFNVLSSYFEPQKKSSTKRAIVTAGPTYEMLDPVRFIGNFSSGKMGIALANALLQEGYTVDLICGPGVQNIPEHENILVTHIVSAQELFETVKEKFSQSHITVMAAAVADFRPSSKADQKIKKKEGTDEMMINLVKNPDILAHLGQIKRNDQILVGFALESEHELDNALSKLKRKKADYIALNSLQQEGGVFGKDTNQITLLSKSGSKIAFEKADKSIVAREMISYIIKKNNDHED